MLENLNAFDVPDKVAALHIYPIKSCHEATVDGRPVTELITCPTGFRVGRAIDRGWVVADADDRFVSQRGWNEKRGVEFPGDSVLATVAVDIQDGHLDVSAPGHGEIVVPFAWPSGKETTIEIFGPELPVIEESEIINAFFCDLLDRSVRLTRADPMRPRLLAENYRRPMAANQSAGADGRPISLASHASLDYLHDLEEVTRGSLPLTFCRANIDIDGYKFGAFGEDKLRFVRVGEIGAYVVKGLSRCRITKLNQETGAYSSLAGKILRSRRGWAVGGDTAVTPDPYFAQSLNHTYVQGRCDIVRVNDPVVAVETGDSNVILKAA